MREKAQRKNPRARGTRETVERAGRRDISTSSLRLCAAGISDLAGEDPAKRLAVDIGPGDDDADRLSRKRLAHLHQAGEPGGARPLGEVVGGPEQEADRVGDRRPAHLDETGGPPAQGGGGEVVGGPGGEALGGGGGGGPSRRR